MTTVRIEVAYALPERQTLLVLEVPEGTTVEAAIGLSGIALLHPEIDLRTQKVGIFGKFAELAHVVLPGDRIEIYRPLIADAKSSRHARVAKKREERASAKNMRT